MIGELLNLIDDLTSDSKSATFVQMWDNSIVCRFCFSESKAHEPDCPYIKAKELLKQHKRDNEVRGKDISTPDDEVRFERDRLYALFAQGKIASFTLRRDRQRVVFESSEHVERFTVKIPYAER